MCSSWTWLLHRTVESDCIVHVHLLVTVILSASIETVAIMTFSTVFIPVAGFLAAICNVLSLVLLVVDNIQAAKERDANEVTMRQELWAS